MTEDGREINTCAAEIFVVLKFPAGLKRGGWSIASISKINVSSHPPSFYHWVPLGSTKEEISTYWDMSIIKMCVHIKSCWVLSLL